MKTLPLGPQTDCPNLPRVGFGGMPLSIKGRPDESSAVGVLHAVLDAGVRLIDTADVYCVDHTDIGHNERLFAKAVASWNGDRDAVLIATKGGLIRPEGRWEQDASPTALRRACENSLQALGVERIDLYQLHAPDNKVPFAETIHALAKLRDEGKIRWVGLSNVSVAEIETAREILPITTVQNRLNPFFRESIKDGVVSHCATHGIGFLAYSPVGGGRLNQTLPNHSVAREIASKHDATTHEVVLAWVLAQGESVFIIPGARSVKNGVSSLRADAIELSAEETARLNDAEWSIA